MPKVDPALFDRHQELVPFSVLEKRNFLLIGCGSLGSTLARILARLGVSRFHLIDPDTVTHHHLNRAAYHHDQIGQNKAAALSTVLDRIHKGVRCITTSKPFEPDHLTEEREDVIIITTSDPRLPPKVMGAVSEWAKENRPLLMVARHAGLTGGYWMADLAKEQEVAWPSDLPWLSLKNPPVPKDEARIATTANFAASITAQALVDQMAHRESNGADRPKVKHQLEFDLGAIVHESG